MEYPGEMCEVYDLDKLVGDKCAEMTELDGVARVPPNVMTEIEYSLCATNAIFGVIYANMRAPVVRAAFFAAQESPTGLVEPAVSAYFRGYAVTLVDENTWMLDRTSPVSRGPSFMNTMTAFEDNSAPTCGVHMMYSKYPFVRIGKALYPTRVCRDVGMDDIRVPTVLPYEDGMYVEFIGDEPWPLGDVIIRVPHPAWRMRAYHHAPLRANTFLVEADGVAEVLLTKPSAGYVAHTTRVVYLPATK